MSASIAHARTIRLLLVEGTPTGIITAEVGNWTGKVVVASRTALPVLKTRPEAKRTGVYLLLGLDPANPLKERVYIGESDDVVGRLDTHNGDEAKGFFGRVCLIVSKDENLTKAHARWLESRLIAQAIGAKRAVVDNCTNPGFDGLPEADKADMHYFLGQIGLVLPVLGIHVLQPEPTVSHGPSTEADAPLPVVVFEMVVGPAKASASEAEGKLVVHKGSTARKIGTAGWDTYRKLREQLVADGKLVDSRDEALLEFAEDVAFDSPSAAATVVSASNVNGPLAWKVKGTGMTYRAWQQESSQRMAP
jgi:predicted GIY-YIG superfamily endonuclease